VSTAGADAYLFESFASSDALFSGDKGWVGSHLAETAFGLFLLLLDVSTMQFLMDQPHGLTE